jgi:hypothetical protein
MRNRLVSKAELLALGCKPKADLKPDAQHSIDAGVILGCECCNNDYRKRVQN